MGDGCGTAVDAYLISEESNIAFSSKNQVLKASEISNSLKYSPAKKGVGVTNQKGMV